MKSIYPIKSKTKIAITLLSMIILLLCGVLVERYFFSKINEGSASIYNDRLIPSTAIYHLSDHISERRFLLLNDTIRAEETKSELAWHRYKEDSIITAFEQTYLVADESKALNQLKSNLDDYNKMEAELLSEKSIKDFALLEQQYSGIREELLALSNIQTRVGLTLQKENDRLNSNADVISQLLVIVLILTCLIAQAFVLASKSIIPSLQQKHNLKWFLKVEVYPFIR